jgi:pimeloyl-ACP methyl ester carboxylesterase
MGSATLGDSVVGPDRAARAHGVTWWFARGVCLGLVVLVPLAPPVPAHSSEPEPVRWQDCAGGFECARLSLTDGGIELAVIRRPAGEPDERRGSLLVHPGGPGLSAVGYLRRRWRKLGPQLARHFDLVAFDPSGVGESGAIDCHASLPALLSAPLDPSDPADWSVLRDRARLLAQECGARHGPELARMSTRDVARDMEAVRVALGETRISFLGFSYGTLLGAAYADRFPERVAHFVLDGAVDPALDAIQMALQQAVAVEAALERMLDFCDQRRCDLARRRGARIGFGRVAQRVAEARWRKRAGRRSPSALEWASALATGLGDAPDSWRSLTGVLAEADAGDARRLLELADLYLGRGARDDFDGTFEAGLATSCLDRSSPRDSGVWREAMRSLPENATQLGAENLALSLPCAFWPAQAQPLGQLRAKDAPPLLVVGTTGDPFTPYAWSQRLADSLESALLVTLEGEGHTAFRRGYACVDELVERYLLEAKLPDPDTRCSAD